MIPPKLPDAYQAISEKLFSSVTSRILRRIRDWDFALGKDQIEGLRQFFRKNSNALGDRSFIIELTQQDDKACAELSADLIAKANEQYVALIKIGANLRVLGVTVFDASVESEVAEEEACDASENKVIVFYEQRSSVRFYANLSFAGAIDPRDGGRPGKHSRFARRAEQYEEAILDHYRREVRDWNGSDHWADRQKRHLRSALGKATKTEHIFQNSLMNWLSLHLDADVKGPVGLVSSDETDIEITAPGKLYIVELKWLGKNEKGTTYKIKRVAEGLRQVRDYLTKQGRARKATLVVYDGRAKEDFEALTNVTDEPDDGCKCLDGCEAEVIPPRSNCMILFLRSTTASEQ